MTELWMGVDFGTQSVKVLVVDNAGTVLKASREPLTSERQRERHEQSPAGWWSAFTVASRSALRDLEASRVRAVAVCATSGTVLLADRDSLRPAGPALMYDDARAAVEARRASEAGADVWAALGYGGIQAVWGLPKLLWLLDQSDEVRTGLTLLHQTDYINARLVGHLVGTDVSSALKSGADPRLVDWPYEVFDRLGVPERVLPGIVLSGDPLGQVCEGAAEETGLAAGTPVIAGMTDGCAAQLGAGAVEPGAWNSVLGTTLVVKGVSEHLLLDPLMAVYSHRSPDGHWLPGGASSSGLGVARQVLGDVDLGRLDQTALARTDALGVVYPLVGGGGERFPFVAAEARAFSSGVGDDAVARYRALLAGLAGVERLAYDRLAALGATPPAAVRSTGGGAASEFGNRIRAAMLGVPIEVPAVAEPAFGMAILAAAQGHGTEQAAQRMVRLAHIREPDPTLRGPAERAFSLLTKELDDRGWLPPEFARRGEKESR